MSLIGRFEHMVKRPRADEASQILLKVASLVKPIMKSHSWKVGVLAEFVPSDASLLGMNMNRGTKIFLRLRPPGALDTFYDTEQLVLVMLHELTHNVYGPHDASFYKLLEQLEEEWYELKRKGYSGDGFFSDGARLGGSHDVPLHIGRIKALEAAEKRRKKLLLMSGGGKLGGGAIATKGKTMREVLAEAAERRIKDDKSCVHDGKSAEEEARKAEMESEGVDAKDLPGADGEEARETNVIGQSGAEETTLANQRDPGRFPPPLSDTAKEAVRHVEPKPPRTTEARPASTTRAATRPTSQQPQLKKRRLAPSPPPQPTLINADGTWNCPTCTLINPSGALACDACGGPQPRDESRGWWCDVCLEFGNAHDRWMCQSCGSIKRKG